MIFMVETYIRKKSYEKYRRKFRNKSFNVSGPSKLSMFGILGSFTATTPTCEKL